MIIVNGIKFVKVCVQQSDLHTFECRKMLLPEYFIIMFHHIQSKSSFFVLCPFLPSKEFTCQVDLANPIRYNPTDTQLRRKSMISFQSIVIIMGSF